MRRFVLCVALAIIGGTGVATVLALGVASFSAAAFKVKAGTQTPVYESVQSMQQPVIVAASIGFIVGAGIIAWMFYGRGGSGTGPEDGAEGDQSEV